MADSSSKLDLRAEVEAALSTDQFVRAYQALGALWRSAPSLSLSAYVSACVDRIRPHLDLRPCKVAVSRSFTVEPVTTMFRAAAAVAGIDAHVELGEFGAYTQEILDASSRLYACGPDVAILALQTRDIAPELWSGFGLSAVNSDHVADRVLGELVSLVRNFRERSAAHLFVHNLEQPSRATLGLLDSRSDRGQLRAIERINREFEAFARSERGVYVLDYDGLVARHGRATFHDESKWFATRMPFAAASIPHVANEWLRAIHPAVGKSCKVLVTDLDNTLWGGVVGEDGASGIKLGVEYPGAVYLSIQRALLDLRSRGILLAVASKNNPSDALEIIERHPEMLLRGEHFSSMRINWNDKARSLREIATELNVGLDALAFFDDNPSERKWVQEQLPEVTVFDLPRDTLQWPETVRSAHVFERLAISSEDLERSAYYAADKKRDSLRESSATLDDYLRTLQTSAEVGWVDAATLSRVAQLTQKTNQFNLSTRRYSEQQLAALAEDPDWHVLWMRVRDRFGDHGIVGAAIAHVRAGVCEIDTFLLSCRVIGRTVETALLSTLAAVARENGASHLAGWFRPSAKNAPARGFFHEHGFAQTEEHPDGTLWTLDLTRSEVAMPPWVATTVNGRKRHG